MCGIYETITSLTLLAYLFVCLFVVSLLNFPNDKEIELKEFFFFDMIFFSRCFPLFFFSSIWDRETINCRKDL